MSELVRLIDEYRRTHGNPSEASVSRFISPTQSPNLIRAWRARGIKEIPKTSTLMKLAEFLRVDPMVVITAAAIDVGMVDKRSDGDDVSDAATPIARDETA